MARSVYGVEYIAASGEWELFPAADISTDRDRAQVFVDSGLRCNGGVGWRVVEFRRVPAPRRARARKGGRRG